MLYSRLQKSREKGPGMIYPSFPPSLGFGVGGQSYSKLVASTVDLQVESSWVL